MKKLRFLYTTLIIIIVFTSCSKDDDSNNESNSIQGIWKPIKYVEVCSTGNEKVFELDECVKKSRYEFVGVDSHDSGVLIVKEFRIINNNCELYIDETNGFWIIENNSLIATIDEETKTPTFFELKSDSFKIGYYVDENDPQFTPCDGENIGSHYYTEFIRI